MGDSFAMGQGQFSPPNVLASDPERLLGGVWTVDKPNDCPPVSLGPGPLLEAP